MAAKFEVGKKVIALYDHQHGIFKKGDIFTLKGIFPPICKCGYKVVDIGNRKDYHDYQNCTACGDKFLNPLSIICLYQIEFFAPLEEDEISDTTIEQVLAEMQVAELVEK